VLRYELSQAACSRAPLSLLLIDLDEFKRINDTHGHREGDHVLQEVALRLRCALRLTDSAGRWGGEEFLAVLPGTDTPGALLVAERFLRELRLTPIGHHGLRVTASVGVSCYPVDADEAASLVDCADVALYEAKEYGKDRVVAFDPEQARETHDHTRRFTIRPLLERSHGRR